MFKVKLYRLGSDPEFMFTRMQEWTHYVVPANQVIVAERGTATQSFIGTDGHQATAELRPPPARNIYRHLYDIASAIDETDKFLGRKKNLKDVRMFAAPMVAQEPLGGHIHVTMFSNNKDDVILQNMGLYLDPQNGFTGFQNRAPVDVFNETERLTARRNEEFLQKYAKLVNTSEAPLAPAAFSIGMSYLLKPFEYWVQPWPQRLSRNRRYGMGADVVRIVNSPRPYMPKYTPEEWAYLHYEYRLPSTWLVHPDLAYVYFALAKLTILNWGHLYKTAHKNHNSNPKYDTTFPGNEAFREQFMDRLASVRGMEGYKESKDLHNLLTALDSVRTNREKWFAPGYSVDILRWRKLIA